MDRNEVETIFRTTIEDRRLSRTEKRALKEIIADWAPDDEAFAFLRNRAFEIAKENLRRHEDRQVLEWLEDVVRACVPRRRDDEVIDVSQAWFSPREDCPAEIARLLRRAHNSIDVCVFTITDDRIAKALDEAHGRGVRVRIIADDDKAHDRGSDVDRLEEAGIPVCVDDSDAHMHHKFAIFDNRTVLTGSYNWTRSAARENHENLVLLGDPGIVRAFRQEFDRLWEAFGGR